jgi:hypothetical protein
LGILEKLFLLLQLSIVNCQVSIKAIKKLFWGDFWIFTFIENYRKLRQKLSLSIKKSVIELSTLPGGKNIHFFTPQMLADQLKDPKTSAWTGVQDPLGPR